MERKISAEMFILRSVACLSIALLHSMNRVYSENNEWSNLLGVLLTFGTPMFVFISEFVLSYAYADRSPPSFWQKRVKYILLPYVFFGAIYALLKGIDLSRLEHVPLTYAFLHFLWRHLLLGDYHGYFILIIFQFYGLHLLFQTYAKRISPRLALIVSFIVNMGYLGYFNFTEPGSSAVSAYIWEKMYWLPFPGWLFYFTIAFYWGRNEARVRELLNRYRPLVYLLPLASAALVVTMTENGWLTVHSSKRVDMVPFTVTMIIALYVIASRMNKIPAPFVWISRYSFSIYLLHPLFLAILVKMLPSFHLPGLLSVAVLLAGCVLGSIATAFLAYRIPGGSFVLGRIGVGLKRESEVPKGQSLSQNISGHGIRE